LGKTDEAQSSASPQDNVRTEADAQSMPPPPAAAQGRERREGT